MIHDVLISGQIGTLPEDVTPGFELVDLIGQIETAKKIHQDLTGINVNIKSPGGRVDTGDNIYDYLIGLKTKMTVDTTSLGEVSSIASKIFMAGTRRRIGLNDTMLIHAPWADPGPGTADQFQDASESLRETEKEMAKFYASVTGVEVSAIQAIMKDETILDGQKAVDLNFATELRLPMVAVAYNIKEKEITKKDIMSKLKDAFTVIQKALEGNTPPVALDLRGAENEIYRSTAEDDAGLVGSTLSVIDEEGNETPTPASTYMLEDGRALVTDENSVVTEVIPAEEMKGNEELAKMQTLVDTLEEGKTNDATEIASLKDQLKTFTSQEFKESMVALEKGIKENEADKSELRRIKSAFALDLSKEFKKEEIKKEELGSGSATSRREKYNPKSSLTVQNN